MARCSTMGSPLSATEVSSRALRLILVSGALLWMPAIAYGRKTGPLQATVHTVVIHAISGPACQNGEVVYSGAPGDAQRWKHFFEHHPFLGIHYIIDREGVLASSTPENQQANHALGFNEGTIGIELVHNG